MFIAHSKNELIQWRGVRRLSVRPSVNFFANSFFSHANGRIATKLAHDGLQQWRRQTIKLGSAIKGQLYIRVGQMERPKVPSEAQEAQSAGEPKGCDRVGVAP